MNRCRTLGAIALPSIMLTLALATILGMTLLQSAGARETRWLPAWEPQSGPTARRDGVLALAAVPALIDAAALSETVAELARISEVMSGRWQPEPTAASVPANPAATASLVLVGGAPVREVAPVPAIAPVVSLKLPDRVAVAARPEATTAPPEQRARSEVREQGMRKRPSGSVPAPLGGAKAAARRALEAGRAAEAYARLRPAVKEARGDAEYLALLALAAMRSEKHGEAVVIYQHLTALEPEAPRWRVGFAMAQEALGMDASSVYREALALSDISAEVRALLLSKLQGGGPAGVS